MPDALVFLFGSGISIPAGYPSTAAITDQALSGRNAIRHTDSSYYSYVEAVTDFLREVQRVVEGYDTSDPAAALTYEDFYSILSQVRDDELGEYDNPTLRPFAKLIATRAASVLSRRRGLSNSTWTLVELCHETCNYIRDTVCEMLSLIPMRTDHLRILVDAHRPHSNDLRVFTLNHDALIENLFYMSEIEYADGFGIPESGVRYWHPINIEKSRANVFIYKLHGSINWYLLRPDNGTPYEDRYGIPVDGDPWHTRASGGRLQTPPEARPRFLVGTFDKILHYTDDIYIDLHFRFANLLRNATRLIVCGYGFRDKAINAAVIRWMYGDVRNKLIVIHREPDALFANARNAVRRQSVEWRQQGKLVVVSKYIEECGWSDIQLALG
jgi:hypothetical protein